MIGLLGRRRSALAGVAGAIAALSLATPASAETHTIYMTSSESCVYDCAITVRQVKGKKVRFKESYAQSGGGGSIGWMTRRGRTITGWSGGECQKDWTSMAVVGRGERTRFPEMKVSSKAQAKAFAVRHPNLGLAIPTWPWYSLSEWKANYARFCG